MPMSPRKAMLAQIDWLSWLEKGIELQFDLKRDVGFMKKLLADAERRFGPGRIRKGVVGETCFLRLRRADRHKQG